MIDRRLKILTAAVIHGFAWRRPRSRARLSVGIAIDGARFGFPEVMLGLHPGLGGTARSRAWSTDAGDDADADGENHRRAEGKMLGLLMPWQERHVRNAVKDAVFGCLKRARPGLVNTAT
jgi:3-hydroxyacyl-CoA dehydrogenase/enoyl-CoA hydratase/3-hydroxybutyryl-CoA epimerase